MTEIRLPELSLILLVGASSSGKSTFARRHFKSTEVLSSDYCRALVADDENDQSVTADAFEILRFIAKKRLQQGRTTVIDATNLRPEDRRVWVELAREYHVLPAALVFETEESLCQERNRTRGSREIAAGVIRIHCRSVRRCRKSLKREGFRTIQVLRSVEEQDSATIVRTRMWNDRREQPGPFDIIGDVHGCMDELLALLDQLGWDVVTDDADEEPRYRATYRDGSAPRKILFVGDLVDRGPRSNDVLRLVMDLTDQGVCESVPGNHELKLKKALLGKNVQTKHGLAETLEQLESESPAFRERVLEYIGSLVSHLVFDEGRLVIAHAGLKQDMHGRASAAIRQFAAYGDTTGETDEFGLPVRYPWAEDYRGRATVVYGHTPVPEAEWLNRTICLDTGCVFGGELTALRYPERELVSVPAAQVYYEPARPLHAPESQGVSAQHDADRTLDLSDVQGKRFIRTRHSRSITIREENNAAALEVMSRFSVDPRWLIYLPPTMAPSSTSDRDGYLEHMESALRDWEKAGVSEIIAEEKHMGSRAVLIVCRDEETVRTRFGLSEVGLGVCYTRTGRPFFREPGREAQVIERVHAAITAAGLWDELDTGWVCLDAEIMPWSAKAMDLIKTQYAAVGAAAELGLSASLAELNAAAQRGADVGELTARFTERRVQVARFRDAYRHYCWNVDDVNDLKIAPFHLIASEGHVHDEMEHTWHMDTLGRLALQDEDLLVATPYRLADLANRSDRDAMIQWWESLTDSGGEGLVLKPKTFTTLGRKGIQQPAMKCRGPEYLRIIYGAEYREESRLGTLRKRGLSRKRSLALREFSLGIEGLHRFVERQPLRAVHECVFAVLALESEPVDPRL